MIVKDKDLGEIKLVSNARAVRVIARVKDGQLQVTHPNFMSASAVLKVVNEMKPRLLSLKERAIKTSTKHIFTPETEFRTTTFEVKILETNLSKYYISLKDGVLTISCPQDCDFNSDDVQTLIRGGVESAMRHEANRLFPTMIADLAKQFGFRFSDVKINKSRTRWGSCNSKKTINLSYFNLLLPRYLIDFIFLHELCHTVELNHGPRFWALLDKVTDNKAKQLTREMKQFKTSF